VSIDSVHDHVRFIRTLVAHHGLDPATADDVYRRCEEVLNRHNDPSLYLGVVGEFSSGKSTFLNALLGQELLESHANPATTCAPTWLTYGERKDLVVATHDGDSLRLNDGVHRFAERYRDHAGSVLHDRTAFLTSFQRVLRAVTSEEPISKTIRQINVYLPAETLRGGVVICDTPGTSAENTRHQSVAIKTLNDYCDVAIVVIPANVPLSQTLTRLVSEDLRQLHDRMIFVVTKMDSVKRRHERADVVSNITARIRRELRMESPKVFSSSPMLVLNAASVEDCADTREAVAEFERLKSDLWRELQTKRALIVRKRLSHLLRDIYTTLPRALNELERDAKGQQKQLERATVEEFGTFASRETEKRLRRFDESYGRRTHDVKNGIQDRITEARSSIWQDLMALDSTEGLKSYIQGEALATRFKLCSDQIKELIRRVSQAMESAYKREMDGFLVRFSASYAALDRLARAIDSNNVRLSGTAADSEVRRDHENRAINAMVAVPQGSDLMTAVGAFGGGATGAFLGTLMFPVVGTLLGGALGGFVGAVFSPPEIADTRKKVFAIVDDLLKQHETDLTAALLKSLDKMYSTMSKRLELEIDAYRKTYESRVQEIIAENDRCRRGLREQQRRIEADLRQIETRQRDLAQP